HSPLHVSVTDSYLAVSLVALVSFPARRSSDLGWPRLLLLRGAGRRQGRPGRAHPAGGRHADGGPAGPLGGRGRLGHDGVGHRRGDRKSTRLNSSHVKISYAVFCMKKKNITD